MPGVVVVVVSSWTPSCARLGDWPRVVIFISLSRRSPRPAVHSMIFPCEAIVNSISMNFLCTARAQRRRRSKNNADETNENVRVVYRFVCRRRRKRRVDVIVLRRKKVLLRSSLGTKWSLFLRLSIVHRHSSRVRRVILGRSIRLFRSFRRRNRFFFNRINWCDTLNWNLPARLFRLVRCRRIVHPRIFFLRSNCICRRQTINWLERNWMKFFKPFRRVWPMRPIDRRCAMLSLAPYSINELTVDSFLNLWWNCSVSISFFSSLSCEIREFSSNEFVFFAFSRWIIRVCLVLAWTTFTNG